MVEFGRQLFETADLDPVYVALLGARLSRSHLARWLIAYWCFYSCGPVSYLSEQEGPDFWRAMLKAAWNATPAPTGHRWPRGAERRHFRGAAAVSAIETLKRRYGNKPEDMLGYLTSGPRDIRAVMARARSHNMFGKWISFKVADMLDAVADYEVDQSDVSAFLYDTPRRSIRETLPGWTLAEGMEWLQYELKDCRIPHKSWREPDRFSLETVFCKHLSHVHGCYPLGKDIREIRHGLAPWLKRSETARRFLKVMPEPVLNGTLF